MGEATQDVFDILVAGAGVAGLACAAALKRELGRNVRVALCDPGGAAEPSGRAVAISKGSRLLLQRLGAWAEIAPLAQPIVEMAIFDGGTRDAARVEQLKFSAGEGEEPLAHMAYSDDVSAALAKTCAALGVARVGGAIREFDASGAMAQAELDDGRALRARLVVAADGARSKLRALADIASVGWDYAQSAVVATIAHEREHGGRAEQHFLPAGPFAALPLPGRRSSVVWNEPHEGAQALLALDAGEFIRQLEFRFTLKLGALTLASKPLALKLGLRVARRFVAPRLALVGDAAHIVHPLAGQGLNLGLRDVAALVEVLAPRLRLGLDPGTLAALEPYERARRFDVTASGFGMDAMNRLFSNDIAPLRLARDFGLRLVDRTPRVKRALVAEAGGAVAGAPRMLRGLGL